MKKRVSLIAYLVAIVSFGAATLSVQAALNKKVVVNLVWWGPGQNAGFQMVQNNKDVVTEVTPYWYTMDGAGKVLPYYPYPGAPTSFVDPTIVSTLRSEGIKVTPLFNDGTTTIVNTILPATTSRVALENQIVNIVTSNGYDGADINFEAMTGTTRPYFSTFMRELASLLHGQGKILAADLCAQTLDSQNSWSCPQSQDWVALGAAADELRVNAYGYTWSTTPPGPISPLPWYEKVISFAASQIPAQKVMAGVGLYGFDWPLNATGHETYWQSVMSIATQYNAPVQWNATSSSPWLNYTDGANIAHTVWFENASSADPKFAIANKYNVGGVQLWHAGWEDPGTWTVARNDFSGTSTSTTSTPPSGDTQSPTVTITFPVPGSTLNSKAQKITATATDNVGVVKVQFYGDATLLGTDTSAPYTASWTTRKLTAGSHTILVKAYDAAGNSSTAQITVYRSTAQAWWESLVANIASVFGL